LYNILLYFCTTMDAQELITTDCSIESEKDFAGLFSTSMRPPVVKLLLLVLDIELSTSFRG